MSERFYITTERRADGIVTDFTHAPCFLCEGKTLGECGHPIEFVDDEWLHEESNKAMREAGASLAREHNKRVLAVLDNPTNQPAPHP